METKYQSCGFGYNLGKTTSNFDSFYQNGTANSINLTPVIKKCVSRVYGDQPLSRFGAKYFHSDTKLNKLKYKCSRNIIPSKYKCKNCKIKNDHYICDTCDLIPETFNGFKCKSINDSEEQSTSFGKKRRFIQEALKSFAQKGTKGSFTRWCKRQGYSKVNVACINRGKKSKSLKIRRKAVFAQNIRPKKNNFGKLINKIKLDEIYLLNL